ncbi:MAG: DUF2459 domain-containing protein [Victivallales bacterium]|nr:DUF2459 domain-containing protein [Victivallales bacterium]
MTLGSICRIISSLALLLAFTVSCSTYPLVVNPRTADAPAENLSDEPYDVFVIVRDWHSGILLRRELLGDRLPDLSDFFPDKPMLEFGWGDNLFYRAEDTTTWLKMQAILWPTSTVVIVSALDTPPPAGINDRVFRFELDESALQSLAEFLDSSFYRDESGKIVPIEPGHYPNSQFFAGQDSYHLFNTCNKWTAKAINSAGIKIPIAFTITAKDLLKHLE